MTTEDDRDELWRRGNRAAWMRLFSMALGELGYDNPEFATQHAWILEREATVAALRSLCEDFGDNDWPDNLHLADVIEKHLGRYLESDEK